MFQLCVNASLSYLIVFAATARFRGKYPLDVSMAPGIQSFGETLGASMAGIASEKGGACSRNRTVGALVLPSRTAGALTLQRSKIPK